MSGKVALIYSREFAAYSFGPYHPLRPERQILTYELIKELGLLDDSNVSVLKPRIAEMDELKLFHTQEYIERVKKLCERGYGFLDYGDTPAVKGIFEASALRVGATIVASECVAKGEFIHAFNFSGGLHHARSSSAAGFCVFNDIVIATKYLKKKFDVKKIAIVDIDAHHADGTQDAFYSDPTVLTISLHEDGRYLYPGSGFIEEYGSELGIGYCINVPLPPETFDDAYLYAFNAIVPPLIEYFEPDIIIQQFGVDTHYTDPLTHFAFTTKVYEKVAKKMHELAHKYSNGKLVVVGGGGYNPEATARSWTIAFASFLGSKLPEKTPENWRKLCKETYGIEPSEYLHDVKSPELIETEKKIIFEKVKRVVEEVRETIWPLLFD